MKIGLDVRMIENSGIGTTLTELLNNFDKKKQNQMLLFSKPRWKSPYSCPSVRVPYPIYSLKQHFLYPSIIKKQHLSFFHMPHFDVPYFLREPFIATVYDLIHILFPQYSNKPFAKTYAKLMLGHVAQKASKIITISENTKKDLVHIFPGVENKIEIIYPAVSSEFKPVVGDELKHQLEEFKLNKPYLLYIGNLRGSKNTLGLINAFLRVQKELGSDCPKLVLAGKNSLKEYQDGFPSGVIYLGEVPKSKLNALYSGAMAFVFPSFYEGFGLPPLEAMACGTLVLSSKKASLPEACGEAALYFDPSNEEDMATKIIQIIKDKNLKNKLVDLGQKNIARFSWSRFSDQTWGLYERVHHELTSQ